MSETGGDRIAVIELPDPDKAPGYLDSLSSRSRFQVDHFGAGSVGICPAEGPGEVSDYFKVAKLCDAGSDLNDPAVWAPLRATPPLQRDEIDPDAYRAEMLKRGEEIADRVSGLEAEWVSFTLAAFAAAESGELPDLFAAHLPALFEHFPKGELWYVTTDPVLLARLTFVRAEVAFELTPDLPLGPDMEALRAFSDLSVLQGIDVGAALRIPLVALSPAALGLVIPALPHALVFCFGSGVDLAKPYPISLASLFRPTVLDNPAGLDRSGLLAGLDPGDGPGLVRWWVDRLNVIYSHAADPTRFTDARGNHDAAAQTAWMITVERLLGDINSLLAEPQATDLDRVQVAFDLLDKAESLLGYEREKSGKGFTALLRRGQCLPRLRESFATLPGDLGLRLSEECERLFDGLYAGVRANTADFRRTEKGARIARGAVDNLTTIDDDQMVSRLCRAVRNSSHGLLEILRDGPDRFLLAANTGGIPAQLPALAPLIGLGLIADLEGVIDGSWRRRLTGSTSETTRRRGSGDGI